MESAQDLTRHFRRLVGLMAARSGEHEKLSSELEDAAVDGDVVAGWARDIVINLAAANERDTQLHQTAACGDTYPYLECARVACGGDKRRSLTARNGDGDTPLHCAARAGHPNMVRRLIDLAKEDEEGRETAKSMVGVRNHRGETALHEAIRSGCDKDMVRPLEIFFFFFFD